METPVCIVTTGARTPLGLGVEASAAAVRAGVSALGFHPFMVDRVGDMMPAALDAAIEPLSVGPSRLFALLEPALREACEPLETASAALRLPLYLALPEPRPGVGPRDAEQIGRMVSAISALPARLIEVNVIEQGHAAGVAALLAAAQRVRQGADDACLVGGVDSYFHPDTLEWLDGHRQLAGAVSRSGFVPGEGAAFCLLMKESVCERLALKAPIRLRSAAVASELRRIKTEGPCFGEGLTTAIRQTVGCLKPPAERVDAIYCDINGERYRGEEWGFACLRLGEYFDDPTAYCAPAQLWGDMGAASALLFTALVWRAARCGYAQGRTSLVWASSEGGHRGGALFESNERGHRLKAGIT